MQNASMDQSNKEATLRAVRSQATSKDVTPVDAKLSKDKARKCNLDSWGNIEQSWKIHDEIEQTKREIEELNKVCVCIV